MIMAKRIKTPAKYYVATYGDMGLEVEFFADALAYGRAVKAAKAAHDRGDFDSYTHGDTTV